MPIGRVRSHSDHCQPRDKQACCGCFSFYVHRASVGLLCDLLTRASKVHKDDTSKIVEDTRVWQGSELQTISDNDTPCRSCKKANTSLEASGHDLMFAPRPSNTLLHRYHGRRVQEEGRGYRTCSPSEDFAIVTKREERGPSLRRRGLRLVIRRQVPGTVDRNALDKRIVLPINFY
ncbi:hypothetical protein G5I_11517 [Acromyrmex echinatior]|uniref:Uncharacterized protein n=1 Tax=Acromyrmex echinatior TaxID=103372 RepID=F4WZQ9_ACREC|nr:hypothetical protein G5I_11517 [Acromyrmex echinatior]